MNHLYEDYRRVKYDVDQLRKKRNEHAATLKNVMLIEDDSKREKLIESHHKVGKSFKNDLLSREKEIEVIEAQLIVIISLFILLLGRGYEATQQDSSRLPSGK